MHIHVSAICTLSHQTPLYNMMPRIAHVATIFLIADPFKWSKVSSSSAFSLSCALFMTKFSIWCYWPCLEVFEFSDRPPGLHSQLRATQRGLNPRLRLKMVQSLYCRTSTNIDPPAAMRRGGMHLTSAVLRKERDQPISQSHGETEHHAFWQEPNRLSFFVVNSWRDDTSGWLHDNKWSFCHSVCYHYTELNYEECQL